MGFSFNGFRTTRVASWASRFVGRALVGASAGFIIVGFATFIATEYFRLFTLADNRSFLTVVGVGSVTIALIAAVSGKTEIRGRFEATVKRMCLSTVAGTLAGVTLGSTAGKAGWFLGVFLGSPLGAVVGGVIGANSYVASDEKKPSTRVEGVGDRELDG